MENQTYKFSTFFWRITASHMITYFIMGIIASNLLNYEEIFNGSETLRSYDSPWIAAGPMLQVTRGLVISLALWYFKDNFLFQHYGWVKLWLLMVGLSVLSTAAAATGSIEGFIYTNIPIAEQIIGYIEVVPQIGLFAFLVCQWYAHPKKIWHILSIILVVFMVLMSIMGVLAATDIIQVD